MNINLGSNYPHPDDGPAISFQDELEEHQAIMRQAGFFIIGPPALIPAVDIGPGIYRVWNPVIGGDESLEEDRDKPLWVHIDPEGVAHYRYVLPLAQDMEDKR